MEAIGQFTELQWSGWMTMKEDMVSQDHAGEQMVNKFTDSFMFFCHFRNICGKKVKILI